MAFPSEKEAIIVVFGWKKEKKEHPWLSKAEAKRIDREHKKLHRYTEMRRKKLPKQWRAGRGERSELMERVKARKEYGARA